MHDLIVLEGKVSGDDIDSNGHANISFYTKTFDHATFKFQSSLGVPHDSALEQRPSFFASRMLVAYKSEMFLGEEWKVDSHIYQLAEDRMGILHKLKRSERITCTCFMLCFSVSLPDRKITRLTPELFENCKKLLLPGVTDPF